MLRSKSPLMIPERRRHVRIITLRNFGAAAIVSLLAFAAISVRSEMRGRNPRDYGRLVDKQMPAAIERKPVEVVKEAPVHLDDQTSADPMLLAPMVRGQWLNGETETTPAPYAPASTVLLSAPRPGDARVAIVGGPEGVEIVQQTRRKPVLKGGFGRN